MSIQTRVHDSMLSSKVSSLTSWVWRELLHWTMDELRTMQEFFFSRPCGFRQGFADPGPGLDTGMNVCPEVAVTR